MEKIEKLNEVPEEAVDPIVSPEDNASVPDDMVEIVVAIPVNTALMEVTVTSVGEKGELTSRKGKFDVEQIIASRMRYLQLTGKAEQEVTDEESSQGTAAPDRVGEQT